MKNLKITTLAVLTVLVSRMAFALDTGLWKYKADIAIVDYDTEYLSVELTPEIYDVARGDLGDIRLINTKGEQVPYVISQPKDTIRRVEYRPAMINRSTNENNASMVTLDFGGKTLKNSITVSTGGDNFRRAVKVEGSDDNIRFFTLVEQAFVFAVGDLMDRRFSGVDLPSNDYRYLRITVAPMATEKESPVIEQVTALEIEKELVAPRPLPMNLTEHREDEENNTSVYIYDLGHRRLPVSEIELDITDDSFYRYVTVQGRDTATKKVKIQSEDNRQRFREVEVSFKPIASGTIYRYTTTDGKTKENLTLKIGPGSRAYKHLKVTVRNYDDKPLTILSATARIIPHNIFFPLTEALTDTLGDDVITFYVGCESASTPRYDLRHRLTDTTKIKAGETILGKIAENQQAEIKKPVAWTEKHKALLAIILIVVVVVLAGFIFKSFKAIQTEQPQN